MSNPGSAERVGRKVLTGRNDHGGDFLVAVLGHDLGVGECLPVKIGCQVGAVISLPPAGEFRQQEQQHHTIGALPVDCAN